MEQAEEPNDAVWLSAESCSIDDFQRLVEVETLPTSVPMAMDVIKKIPIYDASAINNNLDDRAKLVALMTEWNRTLASGPGVVVIKGSFENQTLIDDVTAVLETIILAENGQSGGSGDHFAPAGANQGNRVNVIIGQ